MFTNRFTLLEQDIRGILNLKLDCFSPIEHSIECGNLVYAHSRHAQQIGNIVHNADACPTFILPLPKIKKWNNSGLLVLRRVMRNDFLCALHVLGIELKCNLLNSYQDMLYP